MKKNIFFIFIFIYFSGYSQRGFYIRPSLDYKLDINSNLAFSITTPQGFTMQTKPRNFTAEPLPFLGLQIGFRKKNWYFETGCTQDKFAAGLVVTATIYNASQQKYETKHYTEYSGGDYNKVPIRLGIRLWGKDTVASYKKWRWQGFITGSLDLYFRKPINKTQNEVFNTNPQNQAVDFYFYSEDIYYFFIKKSIGFVLKGYTKNGRNINFSINGFISRIQADKTPVSAVNIIGFNNFDGKKYGTYYRSYGSGIYFGISTDIFPKDWRKKK